MDINPTILSMEAFYEQYAGKPYELIRGRVIELPPTGILHGGTERRVTALIGAFVDEHELGEIVGAETGFWLSPDTMRAADCAFISREKMAQITEPQKFAPFAPDLAVEIVSPTDTARDIRDKVDLYLVAGTRLVWVLYPDLRKVDVYLPDQSAYTVNEDGILNGEAVLSGLNIEVVRLFPPKAEK
jgi:Uma2 family endonuclease